MSQATLSNTFTCLNLEALQQATLHSDPYPYMVIDNILLPERAQEIAANFPAIPKRGSFPLSAVGSKGPFAELLKELHSLELRDVIAERFDMDLSDKPPMLTLRGHTSEKDGRIHVDSSSKLITFLIYFNVNWQAPTGRLRVLYNQNDMAPYAAEVAPELGRCLIFKVTPNCWHGHEPFVGERRSIQLNYVASEEQKERHLKRHRFSAFLKKLFGRNESTPY